MINPVTGVRRGYKEKFRAVTTRRDSTNKLNYTYFRTLNIKYTPLR
jgi:hypothetical protein